MTDEHPSVTLIDEKGAERRFRLHDAFDLEGATYYLVESEEDPEEVLLLKEAGLGLETVEGAEFERVITQMEADQD